MPIVAAEAGAGPRVDGLAQTLQECCTAQADAAVEPVANCKAIGRVELHSAAIDHAHNRVRPGHCAAEA